MLLFFGQRRWPQLEMAKDAAVKSALTSLFSFRVSIFLYSLKHNTKWNSAIVNIYVWEMFYMTSPIKSHLTKKAESKTWLYAHIFLVRSNTLIHSTHNSPSFVFLYTLLVNLTFIFLQLFLRLNKIPAFSPKLLHLTFS